MLDPAETSLDGLRPSSRALRGNDMRICTHSEHVSHEPAPLLGGHLGHVLRGGGLGPREVKFRCDNGVFEAKSIRAHVDIKAAAIIGPAKTPERNSNDPLSFAGRS